MPFPAFRKFCHFLAGFVISLFSATSYAAKSTVCSTMSADAADPHLRIRASIHWSCRTRTLARARFAHQFAVFKQLRTRLVRMADVELDQPRGPLLRHRTIRSETAGGRRDHHQTANLAWRSRRLRISRGHFSRNRHCSNECVAVIMSRGNRKIVMLFQYREFTAVGIRAADTLPQITAGKRFSSSKT